MIEITPAGVRFNFDIKQIFLNILNLIGRLADEFVVMGLENFPSHAFKL